jgi:ASC-1-like (ASCH) protein
MQYEMKLQSEPFALIAGGFKWIEARLFDEKRRRLVIGDTILFSETDHSGQILQTTITDLSKFSSFYEMFERLGVSPFGFTSHVSATDAAQSMVKYYSTEEEARYGVLGISIQLVKTDRELLPNRQQ